MAYMNQEIKKVIATKLKEVMKQFPKIKYSLSVRHHMTLVMTISQGDKCLQPALNRSYESVNTYHIDAIYNPQTAKILNVIKDCMNTGNHDRSDLQSDYFDVGFYIDISIGSYDKPFVGV